MASFLSAHGYDPGPSQRPMLAGAISGLAATVPAVALLSVSGALAVEAQILGLPVLAIVAAGGAVMAAAGACYARLFGRAANNIRAGWLSGMAFGFALWAAGAVMVLPLAGGGRSPAGSAALGLFFSLIVWGAALGALLPWIHRPLQQSIERGANRRESGPVAATGHGRRGHLTSVRR